MIKTKNITINHSSRITGRSEITSHRTIHLILSWQHCNSYELIFWISSAEWFETNEIINKNDQVNILAINSMHWITIHRVKFYMNSNNWRQSSRKMWVLLLLLKAMDHPSTVARTTLRVHFHNNSKLYHGINS
jgi:hypothetical protein